MVVKVSHHILKATWYAGVANKNLRRPFTQMVQLATSNEAFTNAYLLGIRLRGAGFCVERRRFQVNKGNKVGSIPKSVTVQY